MNQSVSNVMIVLAVAWLVCGVMGFYAWLYEAYKNHEENAKLLDNLGLLVAVIIFGPFDYFLLELVEFIMKKRINEVRNYRALRK